MIEDAQALASDAAAAIFDALGADRMRPFVIHSAGDHHSALALYLWNTRISQALYVPIHLVEVATRNAVDGSLRRQFGAEWPNNDHFLSLMDDQRNTDLVEVRQR